MHEIRSTLIRGETRTPLATKTGGGRETRPGALAGVRIRREEARRCDQRREGRHLNLVERASIAHQRRSYDVAVLNVSSHGAMIECDLETRIGARIDIRFAECERTRCFVRWVREGRIGLEFDQETLVIAPRDVRELIVGGRRAGEQPTLAVKKERPTRHSLILRGELHWARGSMPARLRNISASGAMIEGDRDLERETEVVLDLGGVAPRGRVMWCRSHQIGLVFDEEIDLTLLAQAPASPQSADMLKPDYLRTETDPSSPWAARWERLSLDDL